MRRRNTVAAVVLIVCDLIYGYLTWGLPDRSLPNTPGPAFFPWVVMVVVLALSAALLIQALAMERGEAVPTSDEAATARDNRRPALLVLGAFLAYIALLPTLGFILATVPFFAALMVLFGERRPLLVIAASLAMTAILYGVFRHGFGIFLPRGLLQGIVI